MGECSRHASPQKCLSMGERTWLEFLQVLRHWRWYDVPRLFGNQIPDAVARRDCCNQLAGGDLVAPKAQPEAWAISPYPHGEPDGEQTIQ